MSNSSSTEEFSDSYSDTTEHSDSDEPHFKRRRVEAKYESVLECDFATHSLSQFKRHTGTLKNSVYYGIKYKKAMEQALVDLKQGYEATCPYFTSSPLNLQWHLETTNHFVPQNTQSLTREGSHSHSFDLRPQRSRTSAVKKGSNSARNSPLILATEDFPTKPQPQLTGDRWRCTFVTNHPDKFNLHTKGLKQGGGGEKYKHAVEEELMRMQHGHQGRCPYSTNNKSNLNTHLERSIRHLAEAHSIEESFGDAKQYPCPFTTFKRDKFIAHTSRLLLGENREQYKAAIDYALKKMAKGGSGKCPFSANDKTELRRHTEPSASRKAKGGKKQTAASAKSSRTGKKRSPARHVSPGTTSSVSPGGVREQERWRCHFTTRDREKYLLHTSGLKKSRSYNDKYKGLVDESLTRIGKGQLGRCPYSTDNQGHLKTHIEIFSRPPDQRSRSVSDDGSEQGKWKCEFRTGDRDEFIYHTSGLKNARGKYDQAVEEALSTIANGGTAACPYTTNDKWNFNKHVERSIAASSRSPKP